MLQNERSLQNDSFNKIINAERMTPERLRSFPGFEQTDEQEAKHVIRTLENYCEIIVNHISNNREYG